MANPDEQVLVQIDGDSTGLEKAATKSRDSVKSVGDESERTNQKGARFGSGFKIGAAAVAASAMVGVHALVSFSKSAFSSYQSAQDGITRFQTVASNAGWSKSMQDNATSAFGVIGAGAARSAASTAASMGVSGQAFNTLKGSLGDLAVRMGGVNGASQSMGTATMAVSRAMATGNAASLSRYGVVLDANAKKQFQAADQAQRATIINNALQKSVGGLNDKVAKTPSGQMTQLSNSVAGLKYNFGALLSGNGSPDKFAASLSAVATQGIGIITTMAPKLAEGIGAAAGALAKAAPKLITSLINGLMPMIPALLHAVTVIIPQIITALASAIPEVVRAITSALPTVIQALITLAIALVQAIPQILTAIVAAIPQIITMLINAILGNLPQIITGLIRLMVAIVAALPQIMMALIKAIPQIITSIISTVIALAPMLISAFVSIGRSIGSAITGTVGFLGSWFGGLWNGIRGIFSGAGSWFGNIGRGIWGAITGILGGLGGWFGRLWNGIISGVSSVPGRIVSFFGGLGSRIWGVIRSGLRSVLSAVPVVGGAIINALHLAKGGIVTGIGSDTSDNQLAALSPGEMVINARSARSVGYDALRLINATGRMPVQQTRGDSTINVTTTSSDPLAIAQYLGFMLRTA